MLTVFRKLLTPAMVLALGIALATASTGRAQDKLSGTTPYFPLQVGSSWQYKVGDNQFVLRVAKIEKVGETPAARVELVIKDKVASFEHVTTTADAVARLTFEGKEVKPPITILKLPPKKGDSWTIESKIADGQVIKGKFVVDEQEVTVPAGKYKTFTVTGSDLEVNGQKLSLTYHFAENVGMVKQVIEMAGRKIAIELEKYEAGKK